jgi:hypothetical protein
MSLQRCKDESKPIAAILAVNLTRAAGRRDDLLGVAQGSHFIERVSKRRRLPPSSPPVDPWRTTTRCPVDNDPTATSNVPDWL